VTALRIAIAGLGTVGSGVLRLLQAQHDLLSVRAGRPIEVVARSDQTPTRGSHAMAHTFGTNTTAAAQPARMCSVSVQKYSNSIAGTVEKTPVPKDPAA